MNWIGYGAFQEVTNDQTFNLSTILKNSGEVYSLIGFCVSYSGSKMSSNNVSWTQPSNGGSTIRVDIASLNSLWSSSKITLGDELLSYLKLKREFQVDSDWDNDYDSRILISLSINTSPGSYSVGKDNGVEVNSTSIDKNESTTSNVSNTTTETIYSSSFYFLPDYRITKENFYEILKENLDDESFISNFNKKISNYSTLQIKSVSINKTVEIQPKPIFEATSITIISKNDSFNFNLTLTNTNGFIYLKLTYGSSYSTFPKIFVEKNKIVNIEFSNLPKATTYEVSFYASNENYPRFKTDTYKGSVKIEFSAISTTGANQSNFGIRNMKKIVAVIFVWVIAVCFAI